MSSEITAALQAMSYWEAMAVLLGIAYLLLAVRESLWCWYAAFASTALFLYVFWDVSLLMESALQVYYLIMAVYGWRQWSKVTEGEHTLKISTWTWQRHCLVIVSVVLLSLASGFLLNRFTDAALPFLDSITTWGSIITTWMVAKKVLENWLYWLVIDAISIFLYLDRGLYLTALLFVIYLVIVIFGYRKWLTQYRQTSA
jgi:nicotinamide mononucleotide transporter